MNPYIVEIGSFTLNRPMEFREESQNLTKFKAYVFAPGAYPLYAAISGGQVSLTSPMTTAVVFASDEPHAIGSSKQARIPLSHADVESGLADLAISSAYESAFKITENNPYGIKSYIGNSEDPTWQALKKEADLHYFKSDLFEYSDRLREYAEDHGFFEESKLLKGLDMGSSRYEWVIRADQEFRNRTGHGFDHYSIPLHEVRERFEQRSGSAKSMASEVAEQVVVDFDVPKKPDQLNKIGVDVSYP